MEKENFGKEENNEYDEWLESPFWLKNQPKKRLAPLILPNLIGNIPSKNINLQK